MITAESLERSGAIDPEECGEYLRGAGLVIVRGFVSLSEQALIAGEVEHPGLHEVHDLDAGVRQYFEAIQWDYEDAPPAIRALGEQIRDVVSVVAPKWQVNHVRAQLYSPNEAAVGIDWHRDYRRDLYVVAIASLLGKASFGARLGNGELSWELYPGDVVLMRGTLLNGGVDDRPYHYVAAPKDGQRLSIAYRHEVAELPDERRES